MIRVARKRKCKVCPSVFQPANSLQVVCSPRCAIDYARKLEEKRRRDQKKIERRVTREQREKLMTRRDWVKKAQVAFNRYIRLRDQDKPCICCGRPLGPQKRGGNYDAGHYRSVGSAPHLRFHEDNCHAQLKICNRFGAGRAVDYRIGLIARIGKERVEALEADQTPRKYTIDDLKEIHRHYLEKARELLDRRKSDGRAG